MPSRKLAWSSSGPLSGFYCGVDTPLGLAASLGILAGLASGLLTQIVYASEDLFQRLALHWMWWPVLGGVAIGVGGLIEPRALCVGYDNIAELLEGSMTTSATLRLVLVKAIIWSIALGSGTSGGVVAPLLIMGGALGAIFGSVMPVGEAGVWALIGMAAVMGGTMRVAADRTQQKFICPPSGFRLAPNAATQQLVYSAVGNIRFPLWLCSRSRCSD